MLSLFGAADFSRQERINSTQKLRCVQLAARLRDSRFEGFRSDTSRKEIQGFYEVNILSIRQSHLR